MHRHFLRAGFGVALAGLLSGAGCSIGVKRDLSAMKPQEIIFDDVCGLQRYFDALDAGKLQQPTLVSARDIGKDDGATDVGGTRTYAFETDFQLAELRRVLNENWAKIPEPIMKAKRVTLEVRWAQKAGVARIATDETPVIGVDAETWDLTYHHCLSDFVFGAPLYRTRRAMLAPTTSTAVASTPAPEAAPAETKLGASLPPPSASALESGGVASTPSPASSPPAAPSGPAGEPSAPAPDAKQPATP